jgi:hypothetical protein
MVPAYGTPTPPFGNWYERKTDPADSALFVIMKISTIAVNAKKF